MIFFFKFLLTSHSHSEGSFGKSCGTVFFIRFFSQRNNNVLFCQQMFGSMITKFASQANRV